MIILLVFKPNLVPRSPYIPLMCAKFEGNLIRHLHFMAVFSNVKLGREEGKRRKFVTFKGSYLSNGWPDFWYVLSPDILTPAYSKFDLVQARHHGVTNSCKITLCFSC